MPRREPTSPLPQPNIIVPTPLTKLDVFFRSVKSALDVLDAIDEEDVAVEEIFIAPPAVSVESDEDSGEEDGGGTVDNLSGRQLCAPAVAVLADGRVIGDDDDGDSEEEEDPQPASKSRKRSQKDAIDYKWTNARKRLTTFPDAMPPSVAPSVVGKSATQKLDFFLADVYQQLLQETIKYAAVTDSNFQLTIGELKRVLAWGSCCSRVTTRSPVAGITGTQMRIFSAPSSPGPSHATGSRRSSATFTAPTTRTSTPATG